MFRNGEYGIFTKYFISSGIKCPLPDGQECKDYLKCPGEFGDICITDYQREAENLFDSFDINTGDSLTITISNSPGSRKYVARICVLKEIMPMNENAEIRRVDLGDRAVEIGYHGMDEPVGEIRYVRSSHDCKI